MLNQILTSLRRSYFTHLFIILHSPSPDSKITNLPNFPPLLIVPVSAQWMAVSTYAVSEVYFYDLEKPGTSGVPNQTLQDTGTELFKSYRPGLLQKNWESSIPIIHCISTCDLKVVFFYIIMLKQLVTAFYFGGLPMWGLWWMHCLCNRHFSKYFSFTLSLSLQQCSMLIHSFNHLLVFFIVCVCVYIYNLHLSKWFIVTACL
jgi:hypothetical protein